MRSYVASWLLLQVRIRSRKALKAMQASLVKCRLVILNCGSFIKSQCQECFAA